MRVDLETRDDILGVLCDGKAVAGAIAFDLEAGYVEVSIPSVPKIEDEGTGSFEVDDEEVVWENKQLFGKIQLAIRKK